MGEKTLPGLEQSCEKREHGEEGQFFFLFSFFRVWNQSPKSCKQSKSLATAGNNRGAAITAQPQAGKHVTVVTLAGKVDTASRFSLQEILTRRSGPTPWSVTLIRVQGVYDLDMGEREETPPSV